MIDVEHIVQQSPLLGRQKVHDEASRGFPVQRGRIDRSTWKDKAIRIWDPLPNPNQEVGCCTHCAKCSQLNAAGNRKKGRVLGMADAERGYARNTELDPFPGTWRPDDTGSSGLASCKTAIEQGHGGEYRWDFDGADGVVQNIMEGRVMSIGTWWHEDMFRQDGDGRVTVSGPRVGGHQYVARGYDADRDWVLCRCWWGTFRDFKIARTKLDVLLRDGGDSHWQVTT